VEAGPEEAGLEQDGKKEGAVAHGGELVVTIWAGPVGKKVINEIFNFF
jgi:hypothetical protein